MFKIITMEERLQNAETTNRALRYQLDQSVAKTAYIAMMSDVELPVTTDTVQQPYLEEGSDDDDE